MFCNWMYLVFLSKMVLLTGSLLCLKATNCFASIKTSTSCSSPFKIQGRLRDKDTREVVTISKMLEDELIAWYKKLQGVAESINSVKIIDMKSAFDAFDEKDK